MLYFVDGHKISSNDWERLCLKHGDKVDYVIHKDNTLEITSKHLSQHRIEYMSTPQCSICEKRIEDGAERRVEVDFINGKWISNGISTCLDCQPIIEEDK